jgi:probable phosphoglycerate mutase
LMGRRLVIARHGQTLWNCEGRIQGRADALLDAVGRRQAADLAAKLVALFPPDLVVSSDLARARDTARAVAVAAGCPHELQPDLREVSAGSWEGRLRDEVSREDLERFTAWRRGEGPAPGGGESIEDAGTRVAVVLKALVGRPGDTRIVVVGHGMSLQRAATILTGMPQPHLPNAGWQELAPLGRELSLYHDEL